MEPTAVNATVDGVSIREVIVQTLRTSAKVDVRSVDDDEDIFSKYGLSSMEIFSVLIKLERTFDIVIGEVASEFDRIRTFGGLTTLLSEKIGGAETARPR